MEVKEIETALLEQKEEFVASLEENLLYSPARKLVDLNSKLAQIIICVRCSGKSIAHGTTK